MAGRSEEHTREIIRNFKREGKTTVRKGREEMKTRTDCKGRGGRNGDKERERERGEFCCLRGDPVDISINYH